MILWRLHIARIKVRLWGDCVFLQMDGALVLGENRWDSWDQKPQVQIYSTLHLTGDMNGMVNFWKSHELSALLPLTVHEDFTVSWHPSFWIQPHRSIFIWLASKSGDGINCLHFYHWKSMWIPLHTDSWNPSFWIPLRAATLLIAIIYWHNYDTDWSIYLISSSTAEMDIVLCLINSCNIIYWIVTVICGWGEEMLTISWTPDLTPYEDFMIWPMHCVFSLHSLSVLVETCI